MRKNSKGFTMIELLAALIIIGVLLLIAVPGVSTLMKGFRDNYYKELEKTLESSAQDFYNDNKIYRPDGELKSSYTSIDSLIKKKYVEKLVDYKSKTCSLKETDSYVIAIYKGNGKYEYKACISCPDDDYNSDRDKTYCDPAWRTNDNIKYGFSDNKENAVYIYYGTSKDEVRKKLLKGMSVIKTNQKNEILEEIVLSNKDSILPTDIDTLNTSPALDSTNRKETILHYNKNGEISELKAVVYRHKAPRVEMTKSDGSNYTSGSWTNHLTIKLFTNDDLFEKSNTSVSSFQMKVNNGTWQNINCDTKTSDSCNMIIASNTNANYSFRIVTNESKYSDVTSDYSIKVDVDKPTIVIGTIGSQEVIIKNGETGGNFIFTVGASDTGGSGLSGNAKYAMSNSNKNEPTSWTSFSGTIGPKKWFDNGNGTQYVWVKATDRAGNVVIKRSSKFYFKYEVLYNLNGGTGSSLTQYQVDGSSVTIVSNIPTREGYEFQGWGTSPTGTVVYKAGDIYKDNKPITLYAIWKANSKVYISFNANGGATNPNTQSVLVGTNINLPSVSREGYTMTGWYTSSDGTTKVGNINDKYAASGNAILYAHWLKADCGPVESTWGNESKYSSIRLSASGNNANNIYYKKVNATSYSVSNSTGIIALTPLYYKFMYYASDTLGNTTPPSFCYSKYDNLKPYTPHVRLGSLYSDAELLEDSCTSLSETSTRDVSCTIRIKGDSQATISYLVESTDQPSTERSGMSGIKYKKLQYVYSDGTSCTETWEIGAVQPTSCRASWTTVYSYVDAAGNESNKLTFVFNKISS